MVPMRYSLDEKLWGAVSAALLATIPMLSVTCSPQPVSVPKAPNSTQALARVRSILLSATAEHPKVLKILFYGQSISTRRWTDQAMVDLRAAYPNVRFDYRNLALGGWSAVTLERAAARDIEESYPDLIVFHVYGDHRAYERIIRMFREKTAAEIVIQTDHVVTPVEPLCDTGLHLRWSPPPGCKGHLWFRQRQWEDYMSGRRLPELATQYGLALEPRRQRWNAYLQAHHMAPNSLIADGPHPNERGWALMAALFTSWFKRVVATSTLSNPDPMQVRHLAPPRPGTVVRYEFDGNRIELLAAGPLNGKMTATVDGRRSAAIDGCWQNSRVSRLPTVPDWPALKQVSVDPAMHQANRWSLRFTGLNPGLTTFAFSDANGPQGKGSADAMFTSDDGKIHIEPQDWMLTLAHEVSGKRMPEGSTFIFDRHFACDDEPAVPLTANSVEQRHVIATGLLNAHHTVRIALAPDAPFVREVRTYRPPM